MDVINIDILIQNQKYICKVLVFIRIKSSFQLRKMTAVCMLLLYK